MNDLKQRIVDEIDEDLTNWEHDNQDRRSRIVVIRDALDRCPELLSIDTRPRFLRLTLSRSRGPVHVDAGRVSSVCEKLTADDLIVTMLTTSNGSGTFYHVTETPDQILAALGAEVVEVGKGVGDG